MGPDALAWHPLGMNARPPSVSAAGSLVAGDFEEALAELEQTSFSYLVRFLPRLAFVAPSVAARLAWRLARRRLLEAAR